MVRGPTSASTCHPVAALAIVFADVEQIEGSEAVEERYRGRLYRLGQSRQPFGHCLLLPTRRLPHDGSFKLNSFNATRENY